MALVCMLIFLLARVLFGPVAALISAAVWMTYPFALWLTRQPNSEVPFMVVLYGGLCLFYCLLLRKTRWWPLYFVCGLIFGLAMLIRPIAVGIGVALAVSIWFLSREMTARFRALLISVFLLGNLVAVLPWEIWVYSRTGEVIPLSTSGVSDMREGVIFAVNGSLYRPQGGVPGDVDTVMNNILKRPSELGSVYGIVSVIGEEFRAHPIAVTKLFLLKAARSWYGTDSRQHEGLILLIQLGYLLPMLWCGRKLWRRGVTARRIMASIFLVVIYFWGMTVLVNSTLRYVLPVTGLLFVLMGAAFGSTKGLERKQTGFPRHAAT
jgi:4-amino-4-deoxy-L-arabinose transferase-like glycosyltransferase